MKLAKLTSLALILLIASFLMLNCSDEDNPVTPTTTIAAELVGIWWWTTTTVDGAPQTYPEVSYTDTGNSGSVTFNANKTWNLNEYYNDILVYTHGGTCYSSGNNLTITVTSENGDPVDPPESNTMQWMVVGTILTLSDTEVLPGIDTVYGISTYTKE